VFGGWPFDIDEIYTAISRIRILYNIAVPRDQKNTRLMQKRGQQGNGPFIETGGCLGGIGSNGTNASSKTAHQTTTIVTTGDVSYWPLSSYRQKGYRFHNSQHGGGTSSR